MKPLYTQSPIDSPFRQGEILKDVRELQFPIGESSEDSLSAGASVKVTIKQHPLTIVLSPDCDLEWDYQARTGRANRETKLMSHILLCDLEDDAALRPGRIQSSRDLKRVCENRDERYHYIRSSQVEGGSSLNEFYIDFKRLFALPAEYVIQEAESCKVMRLGILKPPWIQHLAHRFVFFLGRVGLPDEE